MISGEVLPGEDPDSIIDSSAVRQELQTLLPGHAISCLRDPITVCGSLGYRFVIRTETATRIMTFTLPAAGLETAGEIATAACRRFKPLD